MIFEVPTAVQKSNKKYFTATSLVIWLPQVGDPFSQADFKISKTGRVKTKEDLYKTKISL